jgi:hypothetical protein
MPPPTIRVCLVCEDIRIETRELVSFMGVYGALPYVTAEVHDLSLPVFFCFVFLGEPAEGKHSIELTFQRADGSQLPATVIPKVNEQTFTPELPSRFGFRTNMIFNRPGKYFVVAKNAGAEFYRSSFEITEIAV